jgi:hypothetical protein
MASTELRAEFLALSATLTGFSVFRLDGTGQTDAYLDTVTGIVGEATVEALVTVHRRVVDAAGGDEARLERGLRRELLSDARLGPVARNLVKLWYVGTWYELPAAWRDTFGSSPGDRTFVVSPEAYTEGLLWPAVGANPAGAKPFGYGMWAKPPRIETV